MIRFYMRENPDEMDEYTWSLRVNEATYCLGQLKNIISSLFK